MRVFAAIVVLCLLTLTLSAPVVSNAGIGSLYTRTPTGTLVFTCSAFKVRGSPYKGQDPTVTSAHCLQYSAGSEFLYLSFDDGLSFIHVRGALAGNPSVGGDFALLVPHEDATDIEKQRYLLPAGYELTRRLEVEVDEEVFSWGFPAGSGLSYVRGRVVNAKTNRPMIADGINWVGYVEIDMMCTGGCSGSPVFDKDGLVIGIVTGSLTNDRAYRKMFVLPVWRFYRHPDAVQEN